MSSFLALVLSLAVLYFHGLYAPGSLWITLLYLIWVFTTIWPRWEPPARWLAQPVLRLFPLLAGLMVARDHHLQDLADDARPLLPALRFGPLVLSLAAWLVKPTHVILIALLGLALLVPILSPDPRIDVYRSNTDGVKYLLAGLNPYQQAYADLYDGKYDYRPGFLYWPGALYLQTFSYGLYADIRVVLILIWWGALLFLPSWTRLPWCTLPFLWFGFEQGWLDPVLSGSAAAVLWCLAERRYLGLAVAAALAASVKQYGGLIGLFAMAWLWLEQPRAVFWKTTVVCAAIFTLLIMPFLVWDARAFLDMTVMTHTAAQPRPDALNFTAFWMNTTGLGFPSVVQAGFTLAGFGLAAGHLTANRRTRGLAVLPEAWAMAFGFSIFFGKFAFSNYYWLLISFLLLAESCGRPLAKQTRRPE